MRTRLTSPRLWWLLLALLGAQTLGLVHGVLHANHAPLALARTVGVDTAGPDGARASQTDPARGDWLAHVFSDHGKDECRLFDQLAHGDQAPLPLAPVLPTHAIVSSVPCWPSGSWVADAPTPFHARAPPGRFMPS